MANIFCRVREYNSLSFGIENLDPEYTSIGRTAHWFVSTDGGNTFSEYGTTAVLPGITITAPENDLKVVGLFESQTIYIYTRIISWDVDVTLPTISAKTRSTIEIDPPVINSFVATEHTTSSGGLRAECSVNISNMIAHSSSQGNNIRIYIDNELWDEYESDTSSLIDTFTVVIGSAGIHTIRVSVYNYIDVGDTKRVSDTISRSANVYFEPAKPECNLHCTFIEKAITDSYGHSIMCHGYPNITAVNYNAFISDVNTVRHKYSLSDYSFTTASANAEMTATMWNQVRSAIYDMNQNVPAAAVCHYKITPAFINGLQSAIQEARDSIYN